MLWLKTLNKWNTIKMCLYIMLILTNFNNNLIINIHFLNEMNEWNLALNLKWFMIPRPTLYHVTKKLHYKKNPTKNVQWICQNSWSFFRGKIFKSIQIKDITINWLYFPRCVSNMIYIIQIMIKTKNSASSNIYGRIATVSSTY